MAQRRGFQLRAGSWGPRVSLVGRDHQLTEPFPGMALPYRPWAWERSGEGVMWPERLVEDRRSGG